MPKGGKRPGAGRPKGHKEPDRVEKTAARELLRNLIFKQMRPLVEAQIANALGIKFLVYRDAKTGKFVEVKSGELQHLTEETIEVWDKIPSVPAFTDLMNRAIDLPAKPPEQVEHSGALVIRWEGETE